MRGRTRGGAWKWKPRRAGGQQPRAVDAGRRQLRAGGVRLVCKSSDGSAAQLRRRKRGRWQLGLLLAAGCVVVLGFCGCAAAKQGGGRDAGVGCGGEITVITREDGSGTRTAFVSQLGIRNDGHDRTTEAAEVTQSTAVVLMSAAQNRGAIGYVSAMAPRERVRTVKVNGVLPSAETVKDGSYPLRQRFYLVVRAADEAKAWMHGEAGHGRGEMEAAERAARDFMVFAGSLRGQAIIAQAGYVPMKAALQSDVRWQNAPETAYGAALQTRAGQNAEAEAAVQAGGNATDKPVRLVLVGSTAMAPLVQTLVEAYQGMHPEVSVELQQTGSAAGITAVLAGACQIGMSSRALTETELAAGARAACIAADGIAVIVHRRNPVRELSTETLRRIYIGEIRRWENIRNMS